MTKTLEEILTKLEKDFSELEKYMTKLEAENCMLQKELDKEDEDVKNNCEITDEDIRNNCEITIEEALFSAYVKVYNDEFINDLCCLFNELDHCINLSDNNYISLFNGEELSKYENKLWNHNSDYLHLAILAVILIHYNIDITIDIFNSSFKKVFEECKDIINFKPIKT